MSEIFQPNKEFSRQARIKNMCEYWDEANEAKEDYEGFWERKANEKIDWFEPFTQVLDESNAPFYKWFLNGKLNVSYQCIDRHLKDKKTKPQ